MLLQNRIRQKISYSVMRPPPRKVIYFMSFSLRTAVKACCHSPVEVAHAIMAANGGLGDIEGITAYVQT